jgi:hypothetical protein
VRGREALVAVALLLTPDLAWADPETPGERARTYFRAGNEAYEGGQYRAALRAYQEAHALEPLPETQFSMGQAARLAFFDERDPALLAEAIAHFQAYLAAVPTGRRRAHAVQHIAALEALRALAPPRDPVAPEEAARKDTLILVVSRAPGARARVGDGPWGETPLAAEVTPGTHRVEVEAPGHTASSAAWPVVAGKMVVAQMDLEPLPAQLRIDAPEGAHIGVDGRHVGTAPLVAPLGVAPGAHEIVVAVTGRESVRRTLTVGPGQARAVGVGLAPRTDARVTSLVLLGTGGALATASGVAAVVAWSAERSALAIEADVGQRPLSSGDLDDHRDAVGTRDAARTASLVLLGGGVATALAGALIFVIDGDASSTPAMSAAIGPLGVRGEAAF